MGSLPVFVALRTRFRLTRYLSCNKEDGSLGYDSAVVVNPKAQFGIERSSSNNELVHIRCCYNNKYLVRESETSILINAAAGEIEEDTSKWSCTLFKPEFVQNHNAYKFMHVQSGVYSGCLMTTRFELVPENPINGVYYSQDRHLMDITDWSSLVIFPNQVAFKGDNDRYLGVVDRNTTWNPYVLQFSKSDLGDHTIKQEISYRLDGNVNIKSLSSELNVPSNATYWRIPGERIVSLGNTPSLGIFTPIKVGPNSIVLRYNSDYTTVVQFCTRNPTDNDYLYATARSIVQETRIKVEEPVLSREVFNVKFRFQDARVYDETPIVIMRYPSTNTTEETHTNTTTFRYTETRESSWRAFISLDFGITMNFRSGIPIIGRLGFEISANFNGEYEWGETKIETLEFGQDYTITIPPMSHVTATLMATRGTCDIPFDYTVRDLLTDGTVRIHDVEGGVYTGVNNFNLHTHVESQPLV